MITILNTSIITNYGTFSYKPCSLEQAKELVAGGFTSAIGHESTAAVISTLLGVEVKMNRIQYQQQQGDVALVFKLRGRAPEGKILTAEEIEEIGYEWGTLKRADEFKFFRRHKRYYGEEAGQPYRYAYRQGRAGSIVTVLNGRASEKSAPTFWACYHDGLKHRHSILSRMLHGFDTFMTIGPFATLKAAKKIYSHNNYEHCD